jgi:hypothetical protein
MNKEELIQLAHKYDLMNRQRNRDRVYQRFYLFSELIKITNYSEVGRIFNYKHCSVMYGVKQHKDWMSIQDPQYLRAISDLYEEIHKYDNVDLQDQNIHIKVNRIIGQKVELSLRFVSFDLSKFKGLNSIVTREELKELI